MNDDSEIYILNKLMVSLWFNSLIPMASFSGSSRAGKAAILRNGPNRVSGPFPKNVENRSFQSIDLYSLYKSMLRTFTSMAPPYLTELPEPCADRCISTSSCTSVGCLQWPCRSQSQVGDIRGSCLRCRRPRLLERPPELPERIWLNIWPSYTSAENLSCLYLLVTSRRFATV